MILNNKKPSLTAEYILSKISSYDIYRRYIGKNFSIGSAFNSPLRKDRNPSFIIFLKNGICHHYDYSVSEHSGGCFDFVMQMFNLSYHKALELVDRDFQLGIVSGKSIQDPVVRYGDFERPEKPRSKIQVETKEFTKSELDYWGSYYQGIPELTAENVYSVGKLYVNKVRVYMLSNEMVFGYLYDGQYWKIYRPLMEKKYKWMSSVPNKLIDGIEAISPNENIIVQKSKKDKMCIKLITPYVCSVQHESTSSFTAENVGKLRSAKEVYISFDSDPAGVRESNKITSKFGFKHVNVPYKYLDEGIKDFAEMMKIYGIDKVREYLKLKNVI